MIGLREKEILSRELRSRDGELKDIVYVTRFVSVYHFTDQWDKLDIEGTFVVYARSGKPPVMMHVYNRKRIADMSFHVDRDTEFDVDGRFMTIQGPRTDGIYGLWFHDESHPAHILEGIRSHV
jgi:hypothetical protein